MVRTARGVVQAARAGASRETWISEAIEELRLQPGGERCGVWLANPDGEENQPGRAPVFRGQVWEAGERNGSGSDPGSGEWARLSMELPLPLELLAAGKTSEFTQRGESHEPIVGPTLGMQHVLWVPVTPENVLQGVLLVAAQQADTPLPRAPAEKVAEELALALEWESQARLARQHRADLELTSRVHKQLAEKTDLNLMFAELAESCTQSASEDCVGAVFALIGERRTGLAVAAPSGARAEERLQIRALSGNAAWGHSVEQGPLEMFWRQAVGSCQVIGAEAGGLPLARGIERIVAVPLGWEGITHGVLIAGLPRGRNHARSVERLERRALLMTQVLQQKGRMVERARMETWQRALLESSEQPVLLVDRGGFLRGMSRGAKKILAGEAAAGTLRWEKPELRFVELFRPREWERANRWLQSGGPGLWPGAEAEPETLRVQLKDGTGVECRLMELTSAEFLAVAIERTASGRRERRKEDVEAELRQTVDWMEEGVALFDEAGGIRIANERFFRLLGLTSEEAAGVHTIQDLLRQVSGHAADPEEFSRKWRELAESAESETQEELLFNWPSPRTIERCTRRLVGEDGRTLGRVEVYREVSVRRLFQSRMVQTEKLASLGQRVSGIVHELSNPLTTILGYAQRLLRHPNEAGSAVNREVHGIFSEAERAAGILRQLLQLSGESRNVREPLSVNELLDRTVDLLRGTLRGGTIRLLVEKEAALPLIAGDFGQLQQVLLNLLQNAQQAIEQSGTGGLIGVRTASAGEDRVRLEVWDDGPGIPGAIQARIFDPFFTTKPPGVGTGLGLAIVLGFVRQHGGTVNVISPPKGGTRFLVEFPAARLATAEQPQIPPVMRFVPLKEKYKVETPGEQRVPRVLVVEDEPTVGGLIADVLRDEGMRVDVLQDGHAALERADRESYDLVICDLKMPGMDGQNFFQLLGQRRNPLQEHVLFVTGDVVTPRTQEFLERHGLPYVAKPFRVEELSRAVHGML